MAIASSANHLDLQKEIISNKNDHSVWRSFICNECMGIYIHWNTQKTNSNAQFFSPSSNVLISAMLAGP